MSNAAREAISAVVNKMIANGAPVVSEILSEDQIERRVEAMIDSLDRQFLQAGPMVGDEIEYNRRIVAIEEWAEAEYAKLKAWQASRN